MKTFKQFLTEIEIGQKASHPSGDYEWKGAQWVKTTGKRTIAKRDVATELNKQSNNQASSSKPTPGTAKNTHAIEVRYSKPDSSDIESQHVDIDSHHGDTEEGRNLTSSAARKHFEKQGYTVHQVNHKEVSVSSEPEHKPEPNKSVQEPPHSSTEHKPEHIDNTSDKSVQEPVKQPNTISHSSKSTQSPDINDQEHSKIIDPKNLSSHVWDTRRNRKGSGTKRMRMAMNRFKTTTGKTADFLATGRADAFNENND
jgi:hypothetical protein